MSGLGVGIAVKTRDCPECGRETEVFESAGQFEKWMALAGKSVDWREHSKDIISGCTECAIAWKPSE